MPNWELLLPFIGGVIGAILLQVYSWVRLSSQNRRDKAEIEQIENQTEAAFTDRLMKWVDFVEGLNSKLQGKIDALTGERLEMISEISTLRSTNERLLSDLDDCEEELAQRL